MGFDKFMAKLSRPVTDDRRFVWELMEKYNVLGREMIRLSDICDKADAYEAALKQGAGQ